MYTICAISIIIYFTNAIMSLFRSSVTITVGRYFIVELK